MSRPMRRGLHHYISVWLGAAMMIVSTFLAVMLLFTPMWQERMYGGKRIFLIVLLFAYTAYRGFRVYAQLKSQRSEKS